MTIKSKIITGFIIVNLLVVVLVFLGSSFIINRRFSLIEDKYAVKTIEQLKQIIALKQDDLSRVTQDYAYWDDSYEYVKDGNSAYEDDNINDNYLSANLGLDFALFVSNDKTIITFWNNDATRSVRLREVPSFLNHTLEEALSHDRNLDDIILTPQGLALVSVRPIFPTNRSMSSSGLLLFGNYMNQRFIDKLSNNLKTQVVISLDTQEKIQTTNSGSKIVKKNTILTITTPIQDLHKQYLGTFTITLPRDVFAESTTLIFYLSIVLLIVFVVSLGFIFIFSNQVFGYILQRIHYLNLRVQSAVDEDYSTPLDYCMWEKSSDEIGELAHSIENMRVAAYESTSTLKKTVEEKTKELSVRLQKEEKTAQAMVYLLDREKQHSKDLADKEVALTELTVALKKKNDDLHEANQVKNEFVNIATHQIKNPLAALRGFVGMIQQGVYGKVSPKLKEPVDQISICTEQIVSLIEDMLKISRSEEKNYPMNIGKVNLAEVVTEVRKSIESQLLKKKLKFKYVLPKTSPIVLADAEKIKDIIANLLSNAIKYSEKGTITISHSAEKDTWVTSVGDQGYGISREDQKKMFTRFYRTRNAVAHDIPGTGLGLYIVKEYITRMNGTVWLESEEGKGSTFSFSLPKAS